jgi:DNA-binding Lrp family transcriptional regulator
VPGIEMDELDRRVIRELQIDPRVSYAALGKQLGVSGMTAATRLNRLRASNILSCKALPTLEKLGITTEVFAYIQTDMVALPEISEILAASPHVLRVDRVTGEFDLSFHAAFSSEANLGALVSDLQHVGGLRRLVVHHVLSNLKQDDGWAAVFADDAPLVEPAYEVAPGLQIPKVLEPKVALAAAWVDALVRADHERLRELSDPNVVFAISAPHPAAGTWEGIEEVTRQSDRTQQAYRRLWYRIMSVAEAQEPYTIVIDALSPVETRRGRVGTAFSRMAFAFADGKVERVTSLGMIDIPDVSVSGPFYPKLTG